MRYYMGVDVGSSSSKGVLVDQEGKIHAEISFPHDMENPKPGYYEHDAEEVWWGDFCRISRNLLIMGKVAPEEIKSIGVSALGADCVPVDENCVPLRRAILYGIDARAEEELREIEDSIGPEKIREMRSNPLCSEDVFAKSLWIKNKEPEIYKKTYKFCTASTYLTAKLTDVFVVDNYLAQLCYFPAYHKDGTLAKEMVSRFIEPSMMTDTASCTDVVGKVTKRAAEQTGLMASSCSRASWTATRSSKYRWQVWQTAICSISSDRSSPDSSPSRKALIHTSYSSQGFITGRPLSPQFLLV